MWPVLLLATILLDMKSSYSALLMFFLFLSCIKDSKVHFHKVNDVSFNIGFLSNHRLMGLVEDELTGKDLFYFGDPVTYKELRYFNLKGDAEFVVPLQEVIDVVRAIGHFQVISPDTIIIFCEYNNLISIINRNGHVWYSLDLNNRIKPFQNHNYTYRTTYSGSCVEGNTLYLTLEYMADSLGKPAPPLKQFFAHSLDLPYFVRIDNFFDTLNFSYVYGLKAFYRNFMNDSMAMGELRKYTYLSNGLVVFSNFTNRLFIINPISMDIDTSFVIYSKYTSIGVKPVKLIGEDVYIKYLNSEVRYGGYISKVIYDPINRYYIVVIAWKNNDKVPKVRDYSYCVYTGDGKKVTEMLLDTDIYNSGLIYFYKDKYYVSSTSEKSEYFDNTKIQFDVFELSD